MTGLRHKLNYVLNTFVKHTPEMQLTFPIYSQMPEIQISVKCIEKLLKSLNLHKTAGPDQFKPTVLLTLTTCPYTASDLPEVT